MKTLFVLIAVFLLSCVSFAQAPQTSDVSHTEHIVSQNSKWVNGIAPGYWATCTDQGASSICTGLVLHISAGTAIDAGIATTYAGGTLTMADNATNYVYLNPASSMTPASNTLGFGPASIVSFVTLHGAVIPLATVTTSGGLITNITDLRFSMSSGAAGGGSAGSPAGQCPLSAGINSKTTGYTFDGTDAGKLVTFNGSSLTATLPASPPSANWCVRIQNLNASSLTVSRNSLLINGGSSNLTLAQYQTATCVTDNSNYFCTRPIVAGSNVTITESANQESIASSTLSTPVSVANGGTGTGSTLTGIVRGGNPFTASELSGDATTSGSNAVTVAKVNGVSYPASPSTHAVPVITASNTATYKVVPDCQDTGGNHLNFTQSGDSITCGTSGGGGGGGGAGTCSSVGQIGTPVASSGFSGTSITMSFSCTSSVVVIGVTSTTAATNPLTVTGTGAACPASWTLAKSSVSHANVGWLYYGKTAGSGSCVISTNVSCSGWCFEVGAEFANMNPTVDKALADYSSGTSSITTTLPALADTNDIVVSLLGGFHTGWTASPTAPLTSLVASNASNLAWYQASSASAQSFNWGITCCGSLWWDDNVILNAAFTASTSSALFNQSVQVDGTNFAQEPITDYVSGTGMACTGTDDSANNRTKVQCDLSTPVTVAHGGTGDATLTSHGVLLGAGTSPVAATSAGTSGQCLLSNGASADPTFQSCPGSSGSASANGYVSNGSSGITDTALPLTGWTSRNSAIINDFSAAGVDVFVSSSSGLNWRFATQALLSLPYTVVAEIDCRQPNVEVNSSACGLYLYDGTKVEGIEALNQGTTNNWALRVETMTNVTTDNSTLHGATNGLVGGMLTFKIVDDSTHRTFYYWTSGAWTQFYQENTATFLTPTSVGPGGIMVSSTNSYVDAQLKYWALTSP